MSWAFRLGFGLAMAVVLAGCRGSDIVMYDLRHGEIVWRSLGTDSDWRECLSESIDGEHRRFYTLQPLTKDYKANKACAKLRAYDFAGILQSEQSFETDITYIGEGAFIVSGGGLYLWKSVFRNDTFFVKSPENGASVPCSVANLDHEELRRYDPASGQFARIALPDDWCEESTSKHFAYCDGGIVVLARHGPIVFERYLQGGAPHYGQKADGNGLFRVGHDGSVTEIIREKDVGGATRLCLVDGWSKTHFAVQMCNGDVRIYDRKCREVHRANLSLTHSDFAKEWLGRKYRWVDDATIVCFNSLDRHKLDPVLAIDVRTGSIRQSTRSEFSMLQAGGVRVKESIMLKERF